MGKVICYFQTDNFLGNWAESDRIKRLEHAEKFFVTKLSFILTFYIGNMWVEKILSAFFTFMF